MTQDRPSFILSQLPMRGLTIAVVVGIAIRAPEVWAQESATAALVSRDTFDTWFARASNAGKWGAQDRLGTLNYVTAATRVAAGREVRDGVSISLGAELPKAADSATLFPYRTRVYSRQFDSTTLVRVDSSSVTAHGTAFSHIDALPHIVYRGREYNTTDSSTSVRVGGVEVMERGIVARGLIVDLARERGVSFLPRDAAITTEDLERWERAHQVRIGSGDVVLIRTGRGPTRLAREAAGPHPLVALWLKERQAAAFGSDGANDLARSLVRGIRLPIHALAIAAMGMPLLDNLDLEELGREAAARNRVSFLLVVAPVRLHGATGSLINPLAIF